MVVKISCPMSGQSNITRRSLLGTLATTGALGSAVTVHSGSAEASACTQGLTAITNGGRSDYYMRLNPNHHNIDDLGRFGDTNESTGGCTRYYASGTLDESDNTIVDGETFRNSGMLLTGKYPVISEVQASGSSDLDEVIFTADNDCSDAPALRSGYDYPWNDDISTLKIRISGDGEYSIGVFDSIYDIKAGNAAPDSNSQCTVGALPGDQGGISRINLPKKASVLSLISCKNTTTDEGPTSFEDAPGAVIMGKVTGGIDNWIVEDAHRVSNLPSKIVLNGDVSVTFEYGDYTVSDTDYDNGEGGGLWP